ncbi:ferritin-like domain-containing protein [Achromobacter sp. KS-M25]|nr:ferritin-like domain-containing protein [Achromobacter aestuarii]
MSVKTLHDLFVHDLSDIYSAEKQLSKALPKMARAATDPMLAQAFTDHLAETHGQIERIDQIVESMQIKLKRIKCAAMEGLVEEGKEVIEEVEEGPVRDAALIGAAQKVEHYEIASYGTLAALAKHLDQPDAVKLLLETLQEEKSTDDKLSKMAEQGGGNAAAAAGKEGGDTSKASGKDAGSASKAIAKDDGDASKATTGVKKSGDAATTKKSSDTGSSKKAA